jgi:hypothetical protein
MVTDHGGSTPGQVHMPTTYFVNDYMSLQAHVPGFGKPSLVLLSREWAGPPTTASTSVDAPVVTHISGPSVTSHSLHGGTAVLSRRAVPASSFSGAIESGSKSKSKSSGSDSGSGRGSGSGGDVGTTQGASVSAAAFGAASPSGRPGRRDPCANSTGTAAFSMLPQHTFVFASFSNFQKLDPRLFSMWAALLRRVPNSVLWLLRHDGAEVPCVLIMCCQSLACHGCVA